MGWMDGWDPTQKSSPARAPSGAKNIVKPPLTLPTYVVHIFQNCVDSIAALMFVAILVGFGKHRI